jgi:hypothetical protein
MNLFEKLVLFGAAIFAFFWFVKQNQFLMVLLMLGLGGLGGDRVWVQGHWRQRPRRNNDCTII